MPKQPEFHKYLPLEEARLGWMWGAPQVTEVDLGPHVGHSRVDHRWLVVSCRQDILPCVMMTVICVQCSTWEGNMPDEVPLHATFDTVASLYDEVRPGYPDVIIDAVIELSGLPAEGRILEIGCGTGQITRPFARRGYAILALEFGPALAALAAEHLRPYPQVRVVPVAFEGWPIEREAFDLVLSAQAFHWIDPVLGLARAAEALKPQGAIALVWHLDRSENTDFYQATRPLYERFLPSDAQREQADPLEQRAMRYHDALSQSDAFARLTTIRHPWQRQYTGPQFLKLLQTFSNHQTLPEPAKTQFFQGMAAELARFGDVVTRHYETLLLVAHKANANHQRGDQRDE